MSSTDVAARAALVLACCVAMSGCGEDRPRRVRVSGRVLIDGQPLAQGYIRFVPQGARPSGGDIGPDGRFTLSCFDSSDGAVPGKHRIEVAAGEHIDTFTTRWHAPKRYASIETSGLEVEITEPTDLLVIELTWDGGKPFVEKRGHH